MVPLIPEKRIQFKNQNEVKDGEYVLYWMQTAQRISYNHALEYAKEEANRLKKPLLVYFGLMDDYPEANARHYYFMLEGLIKVKHYLEKNGIQMLVSHISPEKGALTLANKACVVVTERSYLRHEKTWKKELSENISCLMVEVETNVMVPVDEVSLKEEYSAATIRRKIESQIPNYAFTLEERKVNIPSLHINTPLAAIPMKNAKETLSMLKVSHEVTPVPEYYSGGTDEALKHFETFLDQKFTGYAEHRNDPVEDFASNLSPYLHFGQISPLEIYLSLADYSSENKRVFLDELIIRRELAINFVEHNEFYDSYKAIGSFAKDTLEKHWNDERPYIYTLKELEKGKTHDIYWNACQLEMVHTGKMHGYLRMYWGKKIIEWTENPEVAYEIALYLNNKYHIDGRDPNGFAGVAWCFGKHDRPWKERDVFGSVRYMNDKGLKRKFKIDLYVEKIEHLISKEIKTP